jgi:kinesin family member 2/24
LNFNGESGGVSTGIGTASEPYIGTSNPSFGGTGSSIDNNSFYSPELKGEFGAGLLDLHAVDDTELLSEVHY